MTGEKTSSEYGLIDVFMATACGFGFMFVGLSMVLGVLDSPMLSMAYFGWVLIILSLFAFAMGAYSLYKVRRCQLKAAHDGGRVDRQQVRRDR